MEAAIRRRNFEMISNGDTGEQVIASGVAGAPVESWHFARRYAYIMPKIFEQQAGGPL